MGTERAVCTNADCHHELSGLAQPPAFCPACAAPVITACAHCNKALADMQDPWASLCEGCSQRLRFRTNESYYGVM